jgi:hypothetical protein
MAAHEMLMPLDGHGSVCSCRAPDLESEINMIARGRLAAVVLAKFGIACGQIGGDAPESSPASTTVSTTGSGGNNTSAAGGLGARPERD